MSGDGFTTRPTSVEVGSDGVVETDVAIVGAGIAGLFAAHHLPTDTRVVVIDKGSPRRSGSSPWAQGGMAVAVGPDDTPELHAADTLTAGDGLCDPEAVRVLTREAPGRLAELIALGAEFDPADPSRPATVDNLHLAKEGAQSASRSVHRADATGAEMVRALRVAVAPRVQRLQGTAVGLGSRASGAVGGVWVLDDEGRLLEVRARAVLLATGGCGGIFAATTNQDGATGDGVVLAHAAGAALRDLAFVQFHPTGLAIGGNWRFLLTEALRGAGATLHDPDGTRFMLDVHPDAELAPRHVVASAILGRPGGQALLDATHLGIEALEHEFPTVLQGARQYGWDLATQRVPVTPAAHYFVGGVRTDLDGRTSREGLWAAGEVASTGLHGANRMAGNSLAEALVFGARSAIDIARTSGPVEPLVDRPATAVAEPPGQDELLALRDELRASNWTGIGPVRSAESIARALEHVGALEQRLSAFGLHPAVTELRSAAAISRLIGEAALVRRETRGGHVRTDFPRRDPALAGVHHELVPTT